MQIEEDTTPAIPEWILTYGDMMSLLLTFFIMLVSMSELKSPEKFNAMANTMRQQFGLNSASVAFAPGWAKPRDPRFVKAVSSARARKQSGSEAASVPRMTVTREIAANPAPSRNPVAANLVFEAASAELSEPLKQDLQVIAIAMGGKSQKIEIRGHAARPPANASTDVNDCWGLAYQRSLNTLRYLVEELNVDPRRLRISTAGPNEPAPTGKSVPPQAHESIEILWLDEIVVDNSPTTANRKLHFNNGESL